MIAAVFMAAVFICLNESNEGLELAAFPICQDNELIGKSRPKADVADVVWEYHLTSLNG